MLFLSAFYFLVLSLSGASLLAIWQINININRNMFVFLRISGNSNVFTLRNPNFDWIKTKLDVFCNIRRGLSNASCRFSLRCVDFEISGRGPGV